MKFFAILAAISLAQAAKLDRVYLPPNAQAASGSDGSLQTPFQSDNGEYDQNADAYANAPISNVNNYAENDYSGLESRPERTQSAFERNAAILRQDSSNDGETYSYAYETENGIYAEENGVATNGVQAQGGYSYTGDDGKVYSVRYTADENGFVPQGDHLPTPPPIPEEILRALEQNARDEAAGIYDDGSYSDGKYKAASNDQQQYYNTNAQASNYNDDTISNNDAGFGNAANFNGNTANFNGNAADFNANAATFNGNAAAFNGNTVDFNGNTAAFNGNAAAFNGNAAVFNSNTAAVNGNAAAFNGNVADFSASSVEKAYLPPVARNNNQRNLNSRNGY